MKIWNIVKLGLIVLLFIVLVIGALFAVNTLYHEMFVKSDIQKNSNLLNGFVTVDDDGVETKVPGLVELQKNQEEKTTDLVGKVSSLADWKNAFKKVLTDSGYKKGFKQFVGYTDEASVFVNSKFIPVLKHYGFVDDTDSADVDKFVKTVKGNKEFIDKNEACIKGVCKKWQEKEDKKNAAATAGSSGGGSGKNSGSGATTAQQPQLIIEMGADDSALQKVVKGEVKWEVPLEVEWTD